MRSSFKLAAVALACAVSSISAHAATVVFDFPGASSAVDGTHGNVRQYSETSGSTTINVRVSGWRVDGSTILDSFLGQFSSGLGVTSGSDEAGARNLHTTDNHAGRDFILLQFDRAVRLDQARFNAFKVRGNSYTDTDALIGVGTTATPWTTSLQSTLNNANVSTLNSFIQTTQASGNVGTSASNTRLINTSGLIGNIWMISAGLANSPDNYTDAFKFDDLTVYYADIPEPETWAMMIAGFGFVGAAVRRRKSQDRRAHA